jgi:hypothetical protein
MERFKHEVVPLTALLNFASANFRASWLGAMQASMTLVPLHAMYLFRECKHPACELAKHLYSMRTRPASGVNCFDKYLYLKSHASGLVLLLVFLSLSTSSFC